MDWKYVLFSFDGRINRGKFWLATAVMLPLSIAAVIIDRGETGTASIVATLVILYPSIAVGVKRCHDRDRSGWFVLLSLVPIVNLWYAIEVGFLPGTEGPNSFGNDPLSQQGLRIVNPADYSRAPSPPSAG